jgi:plastocyanin
MRRVAAVLAALALLVAAGCGGGGDDGASDDTTPSEQTTETGDPGQGGQVLRLEADPSGALRFDVEELTAEAPDVELVMTNPSSVPHNIAVEGNGVDEEGPVVTGGEESRLTLRNLAPGEYTFYCSVPGHEDQMRGDLVVAAGG